MENKRYNDEFEKSLVGWLDEVEKVNKKNVKNIKAIQDKYWNR